MYTYNKNRALGLGGRRLLIGNINRDADEVGFANQIFVFTRNNQGWNFTVAVPIRSEERAMFFLAYAAARRTRRRFHMDPATATRYCPSTISRLEAELRRRYQEEGYVQEAAYDAVIERAFPSFHNSHIGKHIP